MRTLARRVASALAALIVLSAFVTAGLALQRSQERGRAALRARFDARNQLSADFVGTYITQLVARMRNQAEHYLADPTVNPESFDALVDALAMESATVVDADGRVLMSTLATRVSGDPAPDHRGTLAIARRGGPAITSVVRSDVTGLSVIAVATAYDTSIGTRTLEATFTVPLPFIGAFLHTGSSGTDSGGYLVDDEGNLVAASSALPGFGGTLGERDPMLGARALRAKSGTYGRGDAARYFTTAKVPGMPWRVVRTVPTAVLLAAVEGSGHWVPWVLFWLVAALAVVVAVAGSRYVNGRRLLATARDDAMRASALKSQFVANMSHEIRTPLNGVIGMNSLLSTTELTDEQRELVDGARRAGESLLELVNDILDLSKVEAGQMVTEHDPFDVRSLVDDVIGNLAPTAAARGLTLVSEVDPEVPQVIVTDRLRLRQILVNLVSNGLKFTFAGGVQVEVRTAADDEVSFAVVDTGIGIAPEAQSNIFQPFVQGDASTTRRFGGTGLGLAISNRLATLLGGSLSVDSAPGAGSRFTLKIPVGIIEDTAALDAVVGTSTGERPVAPKATFGKRILVAEDNPINQRVLVAMLERLGYRADVVADGRAAVAAARDGDYAAVLMDCQMPLMDGYDATRQIRTHERRVERPPVPIVAVTAAAMTGDRDRALEAGMDDYVTKPLVIDRLGLVLAAATGVTSSSPRSG